MGNLIKVSANSRTNLVAGAIAGIIRDDGSAEMQAIGAGAVNQAVKALAIASGYLAGDGIEVRSQRASIIEEKQKAFQCLDLHSIDGLLAMRIANLINEYYAAKIVAYEPQITILAELIKEQQHNDRNNRYYVSFDRSDSALLSPPTAVIETGSQLRP